MGRIRIGCAGWAIVREHRPLFPSTGTSLERYSSLMDAVEINSSFYRPHQPKTYARWAASVLPTFRFSVKVPKAITHDHALRKTATLVDRFLGECLELDNKLGGLLVQLPPALAFDARQGNAFFGLLRRRLPLKFAIACEPRHATWFGPKALAILQRYQVNLVAADPAPIHKPALALLPSDTGRWRYWRLHGSPRMYYSAYPDDFLAALVGTLRHAARTSDVWVIFDNTTLGHAVNDAIRLKRLVNAAEHTQAMNHSHA